MTDRLLTIAEYSAVQDDCPTELVRGRVVPNRYLFFKQALVTTNVLSALHERVEGLELGDLTVGGVGVITGRNPDTVRATKIAYFSFARNPKSFLRNNHWEAIPDLVFENPAPEEPWNVVVGRVVDLLQVGVTVVAVIDFPNRLVQVFRAGRSPLTLTEQDKLDLGRLLPESMPACVIPVSEFFEE